MAGERRSQTTAVAVHARAVEPAARILIVDDDPLVGEAIASLLRAEAYDTAIAPSAEEALLLIRDANQWHRNPAREGEQRPVAPFAAALIDMVLPGMTGLDLIRRLREEESGVVPIAMSGYGTIASALNTVRQGAIDYLIKPLVDDELLIAVARAVRHHVLTSDNRNLRRQLDDRFGAAGILGRDSRMRRIFELVEAVAPSRSTVLMLGESGTGKSLIARAIHRQSPRKDKPFVEISCGSIPETLLESELFGHVKGSFTGAHADKEGKFLAAHGGTLFLDEINSASPAMQLKLLRLLQERKFEPVGSNKTIEVDVRVILASNQPLDEMVARREFRQDLYYRINVVMIEVPPLRDRIPDISLLAARFLDDRARDNGRVIVGIEEDALATLERYDWPGNVRELENVIERAVLLARGQRIALADLPPHVVETQRPRSLRLSGNGGAPHTNAAWVPMALADALREPEKQIILAALEANQWNRQKTADDLAINRTTLYKKIKQYGLEEYGRTG